MTRREMEKSIVTRVVNDAIKAGFALNVDNGGDTEELPKPSTSPSEVLAAMFATDDEKLIYYKDGQRFGWAWFVYGNDGHDVLSDHTGNVSDALQGAVDYADYLSAT